MKKEKEQKITTPTPLFFVGILAHQRTGQHSPLTNCLSSLYLPAQYNYNDLSCHLSPYSCPHFFQKPPTLPEERPAPCRTPYWPAHHLHYLKCPSFPCHYTLPHTSGRNLLLHQKQSQQPESQRQCQLPKNQAEASYLARS